jgi:hypothetical protein
VLLNSSVEHRQELVGCGPKLLVEVVEELLFFGVQVFSINMGLLPALYVPNFGIDLARS